jgi:8-oxo-dGTP pyrophosphatase MutT (NUDIX family)
MSKDAAERRNSICQFAGGFGEGAMTGSASRSDPRPSTAQFFALAHARLSLDGPEALTDPHFIPRLDDADPELIAAIAAMRPIRTAAVLVPIIARSEPTVLFTQRTAHLSDHAGEISFPGGKIDATDISPAAAAAALREAEEEVSLDRRFVEPMGYLDVQITPTGYRIVPVLARVQEGFSLHFNRGEVNDTFEAPLEFLMAPRNHMREKAEWNGLALTSTPFGSTTAKFGA